MSKHFIIFSIFFILIAPAFGQSKQQIDELYKDANSYFYFEDYEEALALYLKVLPHYPENHNINYKIGLCYLSIPGSKQKSIPYLEFAVKNISKRFNEFSLRETRAPIDALFYLGNAYFINNQLAKAQATYEQFQGHIKRESQYNIEYLSHQLNSLKNSKVIQSYPVNFLRSNFGSKINDRFSNFNPVISGDGKTLAFTTKRQFYQAIHISRKEEDGSWGMPMNITLDLMVDGNCSTLSISFDGTELYLFKDDNHDGNIYVTHFRNERWSPIKKLNDNINTPYYETHASISADGKQLFFTSNRAGGFGDLDIYVSERVRGDEWGPAKNLGPNINTSFNENTPFVTTDGNTLFFSSEGHNNMGGYDIFFSQRQNDNSWSRPINMGYPINSTDDDLFYFPVDDGSYGLIALFDPDGYGEMDIYQVEIFLPRYQRTIITSSDLYSRSSELPKKTLIIDTLNTPGVALLDPSKSQHLQYLDTDKKYKLFFGGKGYDLRDQAKVAQAIQPKVQSSINQDQLKLTTPVVTKDETSMSQRDSLLLLAASLLSKSDDKASRTPGTDVISKTSEDEETRLKLPESKAYTQEEIDLIAKEVDIITRLLVEMADESIKELIRNAVTRSWQIPPSLLMLQTSRLAKSADSLGLTNQFIDIFSRLLDVVNENTPTIRKQSRHISATNQFEDFFFNLQRVKRDASPGLAQIFDNAIISDPYITSFSSLWNYLSKNSSEEIMFYLPELVSLLAKHSIEGYFNLSEEQKVKVFNSISPTKPRYNLWIFGSIFALAIFVFLFFVIRRKYFKTNENTSSNSKAV